MVLATSPNLVALGKTCVNRACPLSSQAVTLSIYLCFTLCWNTRCRAKGEKGMALSQAVAAPGPQSGSRGEGNSNRQGHHHVQGPYRPRCTLFIVVLEAINK